MNKQEFKNNIYQEIATVGKALANPFRLRMLNLLAQADYSVEQIATEIGISIANASQHLQVLKKVKLLKSTKNGHFVIYSLSNNNVYALWNALQNFSIHNNLEVQASLQNFRKENFSSVPIINAEEIKATKKLKSFYFLDVRPEQEYKKAAIKNAHSIPIESLKKNLAQLPKDKQIVVYCRGPFCVFADEAVQLLQAKGYDAIRLEDEVLEWQLKGLPVN